MDENIYTWKPVFVRLPAHLDDISIEQKSIDEQD
jgi:hypothetical protein